MTRAYTQESRVTITNSKIIIHSFKRQTLDLFKKCFSYTDKSKQFQLKKMLSNRWSTMNKQEEIRRLQSEIKGELFEVSGDTLSINASVFSMIESHLRQNYDCIVDERRETGEKIQALPWVERPHDLRSYQQEAVDMMMRSWRGLINLATGLGKTMIATHFVRAYKRNTLIVCPSDSVANQFYETLKRALGERVVGFYGGGKKKIKPITVGIAASVRNDVDLFKQSNLGLVIFDEVHHVPASTFYEVAEALSDVGKMFGLTATSFRSDGKDAMIHVGCGPILLNRDIKWGIKNGFLAEPSFIVREVKTEGRDVEDKLKAYKTHVLNNEKMKSVIERDARFILESGKSLLVLVDEVAHGEELSSKLGIPFATGRDKNSNAYVDMLNKGEIPGLIGTSGKIGEGTDTKNVDVLILADFTASKGPVIQAVGRALRIHENKNKVLIIDYMPSSSSILKRHSLMRISYYKEITDKVSVIREQPDS